MTEAEWLACDDPGPMLEFLRGKASERKVRLYYVACCRAIWELLPQEVSRRGVEVAEMYVDGEATRAELVEAALRAGWAAPNLEFKLDNTAVKRWVAEVRALSTRRLGEMAGMGRQLDGASALGLLERAARFAAFAVAPDRSYPPSDSARLHSAALLRDLFGNPFRPAPRIDPAWLSWNGGTVPRLAQAIYADRAFGRLPVLADALGDAGCSDPDLLGHCRQGGEHIRGCWAVDLLLGKE